MSDLRPPLGLSPFDLHRFHSFEVAPAVVRNTFAAPTVQTATPSWAVQTAGGVAETNKCYEISLETDPAAQGTGIAGIRFPGNTVVTDQRIAITAQMKASAATPANADAATAWAGLELLSASVTLYTAAGSSCSYQVLQNLNDQTLWSFLVRDGLGGRVATTFNVTTNAAGGHNVGLFYDPFALTISCMVDGVIRAQRAIVSQGAFLDNAVLVGGILYGGVQAVANALTFGLSAVRVSQSGPGTIGSGLV